MEAKGISISFKGDQILISGNYKSPQTVKALNVYVQDPPYAVNQDYDAVSFSERLGKKSGKFSMKIDRKELDGLKDNEFRISLMFVLANGHANTEALQVPAGRPPGLQGHGQILIKSWFLRPLYGRTAS